MKRLSDEFEADANELVALVEGAVNQILAKFDAGRRAKAFDGFFAEELLTQVSDLLAIKIGGLMDGVQEKSFHLMLNALARNAPATGHVCMHFGPMIAFTDCERIARDLEQRRTEKEFGKPQGSA
jgi:hypothetical protein